MNRPNFVYPTILLSSSFSPRAEHRNISCRTQQWTRHSTARCKLGERALGVDYGLRRVGLAVSVGVSPRMLTRVEHRKQPAIAASDVAAAAIRTVSDTIVVGLPVDLHGIEGEQVKATRVFIEELRNAAPWARILTLDERLTSAQARQRLADAGVPHDMHHVTVDGLAAAILLERYFDPNDDNVVLVQNGTGSVELPSAPVASRKGFTEWKQEAMARAQQSAKYLEQGKR